MAINDNGDQKEDLHLFPSRRKQNKRVMHSLQLFYFSMVRKSLLTIPHPIKYDLKLVCGICRQSGVVSPEI